MTGEIIFLDPPAVKQVEKINGLTCSDRKNFILLHRRSQPITQYLRTCRDDLLVIAELGTGPRNVHIVPPVVCIVHLARAIVGAMVDGPAPRLLRARGQA